MDDIDAEWNARCEAVWIAMEEMQPEDFADRIDGLASELPAGSAVGLFERGCARDSTGHSDSAMPLYKAALASGLSGLRRRRATVQLASSLRNLGRPEEAAHLLFAEVLAPPDELDGAVHAFLALALADLGREREALQLSLTALSKYLPRYNKSLARYAEALVIKNDAGDAA